MNKWNESKQPKVGQTVQTTQNGKIITQNQPKKSITLLDILLGRK